MWWPTQARPPLARQNVLFSSAPQARIGRPAVERQRDRSRARSRASAEQHLAGRPRDDAHHRVVGADVDRAVVDRNRSAIAREPLQRVVVAVGDRLVGDVAAGHDQRHAGGGRAAGGAAACRAASRPARRRAARPPSATPPPGAGAQEDDRACRRAQQLAPRRAQLASARAAVRSAHHDRERLLVAVLAAAQRRDRLRVVGVAGEVVAAEPLDRDDRAAAQRRRGRRDGVARSAEPLLPAPSRAAARGPQSAQAFGWAWNRRSAGRRTRPAGVAHLESGHRRPRPVVGDP